MMRIPLIDLRRRGLAIAIGYVVFVACYLGAPRLAAHPPFVLIPSPLDHLIPFVGASVIVYLSQFVFLFLALRGCRTSVEFTRMVAAIFLATLLSCAVFILWPTTIVRPAAAMGPIFALLYATDVPTNCFPSLHVALATIAAGLWPRRSTRLLAIGWAALIALATLTTKQHYMIDVGGGFVIGTIALSMLPRSRTLPDEP